MASNTYPNPMFNSVNNATTMSNIPSASPLNTAPTYSHVSMMSQAPSVQSYFPQPHGNVFLINSSSEVNSVPISNGLSAAISIHDNTMFLKTIQNGNPILVGYKLCPLETYSQPIEKTPTPVATNDVEELLKQFNERLENIEQSLKKKSGGKTEGW